MSIQPRILLIEDDELIRSMIKLQLENKHFLITAFSSVESVLLPFENTYDLIILDILLPGQSGIQFLKSLRQGGNDTPVLMLTVKNDASTLIQALNKGADDYMTKPFNSNELLARINALIRRSQGKRRLPSSGIISINRYHLNISERKCTSNQGEQKLSEKEVSLLKFLVEHPKETFSRADILEEVWGMDVAPTLRTVDNFILKFRKLFEEDPKNPQHFLSIHGKGYRFEP